MNIVKTEENIEKKNKNIEKDENIFLSFLKAYFVFLGKWSTIVGEMKYYRRGNEAENL